MSNVFSVYLALRNSPAVLREFIDATAQRTGFRRELIEKDLYCSVLLERLAGELPSHIVFKGGTCLSKVHADFYRLSEDLDFAADLPPGASRTTKRALIESAKRTWTAMVKDPLPGITEAVPLKGANESTQYVGAWVYRSLISGSEEKVKVEFGLREPLLLPPEEKPAKTILLNPMSGRGHLPPFTVRVMAFQEVWAEKVRAALTRKGPAIRDFFDLDHALQRSALKLDDERFVEMVRKKLAVPGNDPFSLSGEKFAVLKQQQEGQLRPVLRALEYEAFELERVWRQLQLLTERIS
ncbi:MAG TPA: nucleotidyl transferase AbiEii/AbiGii toxin family protein [bacterium]|nr:nucleotidyl transferase AbiEii/AbiGii toxin family protein [bacterium]